MASYVKWLFGVDAKKSWTGTRSDEQSTVDHHQSKTIDTQGSSNTDQTSVNDNKVTTDVLAERERELAAERQLLSLQHWQDWKDAQKKKSSSDSRKQASSTSRHSSYVPNCPHCGRANEYGYTMCDPVHPRICVGGDDGEFELTSAYSEMSATTTETTDVNRSTGSNDNERMEAQQQFTTPVSNARKDASDTSTPSNDGQSTIEAVRQQKLAAGRQRLSLEHYQELQRAGFLGVPWP